MLEDVDSQSFESEVKGGRPRLARAALLMAREIAYPNLRPSRYLARLRAWADRAAERLDLDAPAGVQAATIGELLFEEVGLQGNREDYYDPRNSFLNQVIDRRLGLPITLSLVYIEVARQAGVNVEGIGLPGHFIVAVRDGGTQHFFDPFHRGLPLSREGLPALVQTYAGYAGPFQETWLEPMPAVAILGRMLANLRAAYLQQEAWNEALATLKLLRILQPDVYSHVRDIGMVHLQTGSLRRAAEHLEYYALLEPDAADAAQAKQTAESLYGQLARLN